MDIAEQGLRIHELVRAGRPWGLGDRTEQAERFGFTAARRTTDAREQDARTDVIGVLRERIARRGRCGSDVAGRVAGTRQTEGTARTLLRAHGLLPGRDGELGIAGAKRDFTQQKGLIWITGRGGQAALELLGARDLTFCRRARAARQRHIPGVLVLGELVQ